MDQFSSLHEKILECYKNKGRALIAISGLGGSGKTTLRNRLLAEIPNAYFMDGEDFYKTEKEREENHGSNDIISNCFDWNRLETVLTLLRDGRGLCYQKYNLDKNIREGWVELDPRRITILDSLYCLQERFLPHYDLSIWVDAPRDIRLARIQERDEPWKHAWHTVWLDQDDRYVAAEHPEKKAHIIYENI